MAKDNLQGAISVDAENDAKAAIRDTVERGTPAAARTAADRRPVVIGTAPYNMAFASRRPHWINAARFLVIVFAVPVSAPLPDVAMHVAQTPRVRVVALVSSDSCGSPERWSLDLGAVRICPVAVCLSPVAFVSPIEDS